jgi:anti-sigma-K factor RskA
MSDFGPEQERDLLAAEYALRLLEGEDLREAQRRAAIDPVFAAEITAWEERLAPLAQEIPEEQPEPHVWQRIERALPDVPSSAGNVVQLRRKMSLWRGYAAAITVVAASLALVVGYQAARDEPAIVQPERAPIMVAALSSEDTEIALAVAYDPQQGNLLVTPARLAGAPGHDHELWIIPSGGAPISLGLVTGGAPQRLEIPALLAPRFQARATIALSVEPAGGSPTGQPTGPVIAAGELVTV